LHGQDLGRKRAGYRAEVRRGEVWPGGGSTHMRWGCAGAGSGPEAVARTCGGVWTGGSGAQGAGAVRRRGRWCVGQHAQEPTRNTSRMASAGMATEVMGAQDWGMAATGKEERKNFHLTGREWRDGRI
jgi:hypothetical protein